VSLKFSLIEFIEELDETIDKGFAKKLKDKGKY